LFSAPGGGWEYPLLLSLTAIVQSLLGDGSYALTRLRKSGLTLSTVVQG
jgi:putative oxidoreductase